MNERREADERRADASNGSSRIISPQATLERTLVAAQSTTVKIRKRAKKEAELILREAELARPKLNDIGSIYSRLSPISCVYARNESTSLGRSECSMDSGDSCNRSATLLPV
jgi:cell division septum initiation protein DivIVA